MDTPFTVEQFLAVFARPVPPWVIAIPAAWSLVESSAAISLDIVEDFGLLTAGIVGTALIPWKNHRWGGRLPGNKPACIARGANWRQAPI